MIFFSSFDIKEDPCDHNPCYGNSSRCLQVPTIEPYFWCTNCPVGKTGYKCHLGKAYSTKIQIHAQNN